jgi:hypothetical protein
VHRTLDPRIPYPVAGYRQTEAPGVLQYSHPAQRLVPSPNPDVVWCYDLKAGLRWRVTPHPAHGRSWVLQPAAGALRLGRGVYRGLLAVPVPA